MKKEKKRQYQNIYIFGYYSKIYIMHAYTHLYIHSKTVLETIFQGCKIMLACDTLSLILAMITLWFLCDLKYLFTVQ